MNPKQLFLLSFTACLLSFIAQNCTWKNNNDINPECNIAADTISFKNDIQPIFNVNCNLSGCHSGAAPEGNLNLEAGHSYQMLSQKGKGYIDTIRPAYSLLYSSMSSVNDPMPPTGRLDACTLELIKKWMEQKAKNN